ncbi:MAG: type II toxin-antitoxin system RelE/ParE family toxin [Anaerolineae bacterium]|jgi:mRNA interferase RelE/StbE|nr:type II toxin-antitoxin system RelE/ParE family toxin [Anaerolineae bacterium]
MSDSGAYSLEFTDSARDDLKKLDRVIASRIYKKLMWLAENVEAIDHESLTGNLANYYKYRIGDYRVIYDLDWEGRIVIVAVIGHRSRVYDE